MGAHRTRQAHACLGEMMMKVAVVALAIFAAYAAAEGSMPMVDMLPEDEELIQAKAEEDIPELEFAQSQSEMELSNDPTDTASMSGGNAILATPEATIHSDGAFSNNDLPSREILNHIKPKSTKETFTQDQDEGNSQSIIEPTDYQSNSPRPQNVAAAIAQINSDTATAEFRQIASGHRL